ncbi:MAG: EpsG family protein [Candidatus Saccharimonadaceae bacterium]
MGNFASLIFYIFFFTISALLIGYGHRRKRGIVILAGLAIPISIGAFRYGVGTDYFNYVTTFAQSSESTLFEIIANFASGSEAGFFILMRISDLFTGDAVLLFAMASFLTILFFYLGLRRYNVKHFGLVFFLYLLTIFPMTLNIVRQGIAMSIIFFAISYILQKKPKLFILWVFIAGLFHSSALLLLPLYFVRLLFGRFEGMNKKISPVNVYQKLILLSIVVGIIVTNVFTIVLYVPFFEKYSLYLTFNGEGANYSFFFQLLMLMLVIALSKWTIFKNNATLNIYFLAFAIIGVSFALLGFVSPFIKREALYFAPFLLLLLPSLSNVFMDRFGKFTVYASIVLYGVAFFVVSYYVLDQADIIPYQFIISRGALNE